MLVDHFSRKVWAFPTKDNQTSSIIKGLKQLIKQGVKPKKLLCDNATNFTSKQMTAFLKGNDIQVVHSSPYRPQTNGMTEKFNSTFTKSLSALLLEEINQPKAWTSYIDRILEAYNNLTHQVTGFAAEFLYSGKSIQPEVIEPTNLEEARKLAKERTSRTQLLRKQKYDKRHKPIIFQANEEVLYRRAQNDLQLAKTDPRYAGPFKVESSVHGTS